MNSSTWLFFFETVLSSLLSSWIFTSSVFVVVASSVLAYASLFSSFIDGCSLLYSIVGELSLAPKQGVLLLCSCSESVVLEARIGEFSYWEEAVGGCCYEEYGYYCWGTPAILV